MLAMLTADAVALIRGLDFPRKARANIFLQAPSASSPPGTAVADEDQPSFLSDTAEPPLLTWGGFEGQGSNSFPSLATLRASYAWSLTDVELEELQAFQDELTAATESYLTDPQIRRLRLAVEVAYQTRAWSDEGRSDARFAHALAIARLLAELQMEAEAVVAALLSGVCEETGLTLRQVDELLGPAVAHAVRDVTNVWRLSELLENAPAEDAEQLEHRCQIVLAGCEDWRGVVLSLASRLVQTRAMQEEAQKCAEADLQAEADLLAAASDGFFDSDDAASTAAFERSMLSRERKTADVLNARAEALAAAEADNGVALNATAAAPDVFAAPTGAVGARHDDSATSAVRRSASEAVVAADGGNPDAAARRFALQTLQVFVPIAHRLGMWYFKTELEQRCFALTRPRDFARLSAELGEVQQRFADELAAKATRLREALVDDPVLAEHTEWIRVQARTKAAYSAYTKMQRQGKELDDLDDLLGLRVIFRPKATARKLPVGLHRQRQCMLCYRVLEVAHTLYSMAPRASFKDYVSTPKANGYQSLHSTLKLDKSTKCEIQVRTSEMHRYAEHGKAAHWLFKCDDGRPADDWYDLGLDQAVIVATANAMASQQQAYARERQAQERLARDEAAQQQQQQRQLQSKAQGGLNGREGPSRSGQQLGDSRSGAPSRSIASPQSQELNMQTRTFDVSPSTPRVADEDEALVDSYESADDADETVSWHKGTNVEVGVWRRGQSRAPASSSSSMPGEQRAQVQPRPQPSQPGGAAQQDESVVASSPPNPNNRKSASIQRSKPVLDAVQARLREKRVYATTVGGTVLSLRAGANLAEAIAELNSREAGSRAGAGEPKDGAVESADGSGGSGGPQLEPLEPVSTARVNGRTVRQSYKIQNGDVLVPLRSTSLNSRWWVSGAGGGGRGQSAVGAAAEIEAPDWVSLPVPWPWSLVGSDASEDAGSWLLEAEAKHGAIATLALANWVALASLGEVSFGTEPFASLAEPLPAFVWLLQGGAVALAEASALQMETSAVLRAYDRLQSPPADAAAPSKEDARQTIADSLAEATAESGPSNGTWKRAASGRSQAAARRTSAASGGGASDARGPITNKNFGDVMKAFTVAGEEWSYGFVEMLNVMRAGANEFQGSSQRREIAISCGRVAMLLMACLALHADFEHGILHDFLETSRDGTPSLSAESQQKSTPRTSTSDAPAPSNDVQNAEIFESLVSDVMLQDIPLDEILGRGTPGSSPFPLSRGFPR